MVTALFWATFYNRYAEQTGNMWDCRAPIATVFKYNEAKGMIRRGEAITKEQKELIVSRDGSANNGKCSNTYERYGVMVANSAFILGILGITVSWYGLLLRFRWYKTMVISGVIILTFAAFVWKTN